MNEVKFKSRADALDQIILAGGTWEAVLTAANTAAVDLKTKIKKYDKGLIATHMRYRTKQKPNFFDTVKLTEAGIEKVTAKK
jgi:hypothetical protein